MNSCLPGPVITEFGWLPRPNMCVRSYIFWVKNNTPTFSSSYYVVDFWHWFLWPFSSDPSKQLWQQYLICLHGEHFKSLYCNLFPTKWLAHILPSVRFCFKCFCVCFLTIFVSYLQSSGSSCKNRIKKQCHLYDCDSHLTLFQKPSSSISSNKIFMLEMCFCDCCGFCAINIM